MPPKRKLRRNSGGSDANSYEPGMRTTCVTGESTLRKLKPQGFYEEDNSDDMEDSYKPRGRGRSRGRGRGQGRGRGGRGGRGSRGRGRGRGRGGAVESLPCASGEGVPELVAQLQNQTLEPRPPTSPGAAQPLESLDEDFADIDAERVKAFWQRVHEEYDGYHRYTYSFLTGRSRRFPTAMDTSERDKNFKHYKTGEEVPKENHMNSVALEFEGLPVKMLTLILMIKGTMPPVLPVLTFRQIILLMNLLELLFNVKPSAELHDGFKDIVMNWNNHLQTTLAADYPEEWLPDDIKTIDYLVEKHSYSAVFHMDVPITHIIEHWYYELIEKKRLWDINDKRDKQKQLLIASGKTEAEASAETELITPVLKKKKCPLDIFEKVPIPEWNDGEHAPLNFEAQFDNIMEPLWISNEFLLSYRDILFDSHITEARKKIFERAKEMNILRPFPTWEKSPNLRKYKYQCPLAVYDKEIIRSWYLRTNPDLREVDPIKIANKQGFVFYRLEKITEAVQKESEAEVKQQQLAKQKELLLNQKFIVDFEHAPKHPEEYTPIDWDKEREKGREREAKRIAGRMKQACTSKDSDKDATTTDDPASQIATTSTDPHSPIPEYTVDDFNWDDPFKGEEIIYYHVGMYEPSTLDFTSDPPDVELGNPEQNVTAFDLANLSSENPVILPSPDRTKIARPTPMRQNSPSNMVVHSPSPIEFLDPPVYYTMNTSSRNDPGHSK